MIATTLLFRQIHPDQLQNGFASSVNFRPNDADDGLMSVYDGDLITAEDSWVHRTVTLERVSYGVAGLSVEECLAESVTPRSDPAPFLEHAVVDFNAIEEKKWRAISKKLHIKALARGWLHQSSENT